jgi:hypothetical protein
MAAASTGRWVTQGHMAELAASMGAFMVSLEHRYYGLSQPTASNAGGMTTPDLLRFLNSRQALGSSPLPCALFRRLSPSFLI